MSRQKLSRTEIFETAAPAKAIMTLATPTIIHQLVTVMYNLADMFFISRLNDEAMIAAVLVSASVMMLLNAAGNLFSAGCSSLIARALGAKQYERVPQVATMSALLSLTIGAVYCVVTLVFLRPLALFAGASVTSVGYTMEYIKWAISLNSIPMIVSLCLGSCLRGRGDSYHEMVGLTLGNVLNIVLDPIFIYIFNMGVKGAAMATCLSTCCSMAYLLCYCIFIKRDDKIFCRLRDFRFDGVLMKELFRIGLPGSFNALLISANTTLYHNTIKVYSDAAVAAAGITRKVEHAMGQAIVGLTQGTIPLLAYNHASGNYERMKKIRKVSLLIASAWGLVAFAMFVSVPHIFVRAFTPENEDVVRYGSMMLRCIAVQPLLMGYNNGTRSLFQSLGHSREAITMSVCRQIIFYGPLIILLGRLFGVAGAVSALPVSDALANVLAFFMYRKLVKSLDSKAQKA